MDIVSIQNLRAYITLYTPYIILVLGNIGCICNFTTFTVKQLRHNSCGWYFLMSAIFDFIYINLGLFSKLASEQFRSTLEDSNFVWCRLRAYLTWVLPMISTGYLVLASLDRCLSTSQSTRLRSFSQIKIAHRMTYLPIIVNSLASFHQLIFYDLRPKCYALAGVYSYLLSIVRKSRQRISQTTDRQKDRTDTHLIQMTLFQVISSSILLNIRTAYYSYTVITTNDTKDSYRVAIEKLLLQISKRSTMIHRRIICKRLG
ncbi:hypothetical protein I4U23_015024 [Adineta vaga]|nr:hypothetical protein I4U23_015024 [Adineta vaga]